MERKWWTLVSVCVAIFMLLLDITVVNVALPSIQSSLDASFTELQWVIDAYALTLATCVLTAGSVSDIYGRRRIFAIGIVLFTLASALCGAAPDPLFLILARGLQGIGGAIMFATSLVADLAGVPRQGARHRVRHLGCDDRRSGGGRAARRRDPHVRALVALDLLRQHPDRHRRGRDHGHEARRVERSGARQHRSARARAADRRALLARVRADRGQRPRLVEPADRRPARRRRRAARRLPRAAVAPRRGRCSTCACSACPRSPARRSAPSRCRRRCSRCSST